MVGGAAKKFTVKNDHRLASPGLVALARAIYPWSVVAQRLWVQDLLNREAIKHDRA